MFHGVTALIALYVIARFIGQMRVSTPRKCVLGVLLLLVAEHHLITRIRFGSMASPEIPGEVLMALGWAFGSLIVLALLLLARDGIGLLMWLVSRAQGRALWRNRRLNAALGIVSVGLALLGVWQAIRDRKSVV